MINVMYALEPDYRKRLWPVLAASLETAGLLVFTWRDGGPPAPHPLKELGSRQVGRHTYTALSEILGTDGEACRARYLHRITEGDKVISEEEITGYAYRPPWNVLERELVTAGFTPPKAPKGSSPGGSPETLVQAKAQLTGEPADRLAPGQRHRAQVPGRARHLAARGLPRSRPPPRPPRVQRQAAALRLSGPVSPEQLIQVAVIRSHQHHVAHGHRARTSRSPRFFGCRD